MRRTRIEEYVRDLPLIVAMPTTPWQSMYADAADGPSSATAIGIDLVNFVDSRFHTRKDREGRAVCGLSMGGYGALHLAFRFPERFGAAVSHSGVLALGSSHEPAVFGDEESARSGRERMHRIAQRVFGTPVDDGPGDLFATAERLVSSTRPALRIDCGTEDYLIEHNRSFHAHLDAIGYDHEYVEHPGAHTWDYWDAHVGDSVDFFIRTLKWTA